MLELRIYTNLSDIEAMAADWTALADRVVDSFPFHRPAWFCQACLAFGESPYLVTLWSDRTLVALLPLVESVNPENHRSLRIVAEKLTAYPALLADQQQSAVELLSKLAPQLAPKDTIYFFGLLKDSTLYDAINDYVSEHEDIAIELKWMLAGPQIDLTSGWEGYLQTKSAHFIKSTKDSFKKYEQLQLRDIDASKHDMKQLTDWMISNSIARYGEKSHLFPDAAKRFFQSTMQSLTRDKDILIYLLVNATSDIQAVVIDFLSTDRKRVIGFQYAYELALKNHGIARYLTLNSIRRAANAHIHAYDLGRGTDDIKDRLKTHETKSIGMMLEKK